MMTVAKGTPAFPCECGCQQLAKPGRRFLSGHNGRLRSRRQPNGDMLWCPRCETYKPVTTFPLKGVGRNGDQRYGYCRPCHSDYQRIQKLARLFNITPEEYDALLEAQGGLCAICQRPPATNRLAVDHEHTSGLIRGLVCWSCNRGLGYWAESKDRMQAACRYLDEPPALAVLGERYGRKGRTTNKARPRRRKAK